MVSSLRFYKKSPGRVFAEKGFCLAHVSSFKSPILEGSSGRNQHFVGPDRIRGIRGSYNLIGAGAMLGIPIK